MLTLDRETIDSSICLYWSLISLSGSLLGRGMRWIKWAAQGNKGLRKKKDNHEVACQDHLALCQINLGNEPTHILRRKKSSVRRSSTSATTPSWEGLWRRRVLAECQEYFRCETNCLLPLLTHTRAFPLTAISYLCSFYLMDRNDWVSEILERRWRVEQNDFLSTRNTNNQQHTHTQNLWWYQYTNRSFL